VQAHADRIVDAIATPLRLVSFALRPIVVLVGGFATLLTRLTRTDRKKAFVTRDELALLIESEPETDKPEIGADEREMIANVFELSEYKVGELMVPLSEVTALPEDASIMEAALEVADKQHSRMPIIGRASTTSSASSRVRYPAGRVGRNRDDRQPRASTDGPRDDGGADLLVQLQSAQTTSRSSSTSTAVRSASAIETCSRSSSVTSTTMRHRARRSRRTRARGVEARTSVAASTPARPRAAGRGLRDDRRSPDREVQRPRAWRTLSLPASSSR
jgi:hypothetical protein